MAAASVSAWSGSPTKTAICGCATPTLKGTSIPIPSSRDLLSGGGPELIGLQLASDGTYDGQSQDIAEKVCVAYLKGDGKVVHVAADGLDSDPSFIVFVKDGSGHTYLCNATGDAGVWAFEAIGDPLFFDDKPDVS
jgi:hypothetical protein